MACATLAGGFLVLLGWLALRWVPLPPALFAEPSPQWEFLDRTGRTLRSVRPGDQPFRRAVGYAEIPQALVQATLAAEDRRFWQHPGVDWRATLRAACQAVWHRRVVSGGSTVTQQLIKLAAPRPRTLRTKLIEAAQALRLEQVWSKQQILTAYLNRLEYGNFNRGCAAAAQFYFGKPLGDLSAAECALLAGLPQAPTRFNPGSHFARAVERQQWVLGQMRVAGLLSGEEFQRALKEPLRFAAPKRSFEAPHFIDLLLAMEELSESPQGLGLRQPSGAFFEASPELKAPEGWRSPGRWREGVSAGSILTTLDLDLNHFAENALRQHLSRLREQHVSNGAIVVLDNRTGDVLALVGSEDYFTQAAGQVNGAWAARSPGSSLKPFTYLLAFQHGATPASVVADVPTEFATSTGLFAPVNYDRHCYGPMRYRLALANSLNISAVKVLASIGGPEPLQRLLQQCGLTTLRRPAENYGLGLTIGNAEVRLLELANAYSCLARLGQYMPYRLLLQSSARSDMSIASALGKSQAPPGAACPAPAGDHPCVPLLTELEGEFMARRSYRHAAPNGAFARAPAGEISGAAARQVADPAAAYLIADILSDNQARTPAFGAESPLRFEFPVACKTGTSSDFRDNWAFGYTPEFTVGVWVGNFDGSPMQHSSGVTGAAPLLHDLFEHLHARFGTTWYSAPTNVVQCWVHPVTGKRLAQASPGGGLPAIEEKFIAGNLPPVEDSDPSGPILLGTKYREWLASGDNWLGARAVLAPERESPRILFPPPGTTVYLDPDLPGQGRRLFMRAAGAGNLEWKSDSLRLVREGVQEVALLTEGRHQITVRDPQTGTFAQTWINVLAR